MVTPTLLWAACTNAWPPFSEETFTNIQSKSFLEQLQTISSCPVGCYPGEEADPHLATNSFQGVVESDKVTCEHPFLQDKHHQLLWLLLIGLVLQTHPEFNCPSLEMLQHLNIFLVMRGPNRT